MIRLPPKKKKYGCLFSTWRENTRNPYQILGLGLMLGGVVFAPVAYFLIGSVGLTAVGISAVMLGFTSMALANSRSRISPEAGEEILRTGMENTAALLEELGLRNKAIYLPSSIRGGRPQAIVPLSQDIDISRIKNKVTGRLMVRYGENPGDMAIAVTTPGSFNLKKLEIKPGPDVSEIEAAVSHVLVGLLDLASSINVDIAPGRLIVEVVGARLGYEDTWYYQCFGSPVASVVATIACEALGKPVRIIAEEKGKGRSKIILEVMS